MKGKRAADQPAIIYQQGCTLMKVSTVNMVQNSTLNSSRKMVIARHVSMMAWLMRSLMRSISASRSCPRNTCGTR